MKYQNVLYSIILVFLLTSAAGAESGKVVINDTQEKTYSHVYYFMDDWVTEYDVSFDKLYFDNSSWDHLSALTINLTNLYSFPPRDYQTSFTIRSGGSGGGVVSFSRLENKVHWAFNDNEASVSVSSTIPYVVTYSSNSTQTDFNFTYSKPDVLYHVIIQDSSKKPYYDEMGFTSGTTVSVFREYGKGIYFNVTSFKGQNHVVTINATEESQQTPSTGAPNITSFSPAASIVKNTVGEKRTFSITTNQSANIVWSLNNALVQTDSSVTQTNYVNANASQGTWIVTSIVNNAKGSAIQTWVWVVEPASALDILAYYRGLGDDPNKVEYADIQKAIDDWISKTVPAGFADSITYQELLSLIYQWV